MTGSTELRCRLDDRLNAWGIVVDHLVDTESSILAFGERDDQSVVLKVSRNRGDEWQSGAVLNAFRGIGVVRVLDHVDGAVLLERLKPGHSLVAMAVNGDDDRATAHLAEVMGTMSPGTPPAAASTVEEWGRGLERYAAGGDGRIPKPLVETAQHVYRRLCASQSRQRLLHGDLHHGNVLLDCRHGWVAIDPKGVMGEPEYEVGAALRNPFQRPDLFTHTGTIQRRVGRFERDLHLDAGRILAWAFAQAVLAAVWSVEDGLADGTNAWLTLADTIRPMLDGAAPRGRGGLK